jgi:transposase
VRTVKAATRRKYTPEEKIRIVLEGFRREVRVNDLCRREGIKPHSYYAWTKEFMEAGKERLSRDTVRDATRQEVQELKREDDEFKQLVVELSLQVQRLKKRRSRCRGTAPVSTDERRREECGSGQGSFIQTAQAPGPRGDRGPKEHLLSVAETTTAATQPFGTSRLDSSSAIDSVELPSTGRLDHGQPGLFRLRVHRLPRLAQGRPGEVA